MALTYSVSKTFGTPAPDFSLKGVDGKTYSLSSFKDSKALVVIFMCNHCPYVIAVQERINQLAKDYAKKGISVVGINSNDPIKYPDDSYSAMQARAREQGYLFPYLQDETQQVARAYDAVCTPDPYVYENVGGKFALRYHGRIDDNWKDATAVAKRDLAEALDAILTGRAVEQEQKPAMGCSIKWK
jgi:peroxiredoxin